MHFVALLVCILTTFALGVAGYPLTAIDASTTLHKTVVGRACSGTNLTDVCDSLIEYTPNRCVTGISRGLTLDKTISSIEINQTTTCTFFAMVACINPAGSHTFQVRGPRRVDAVPAVMDNSIQAYICGVNATFATNDDILHTSNY
ncbi:hypothetical protein AOQ84DRAFT_378966 [Glonium stellatum]|uniref:Uncharacterized protein n=1 Tax=Glonium stellatum TaxID=574774 RepID=A0A8E2EWV1_9PEZI|nr:hypothetical protein AOQ84DRAFT_378966 [Glonium stellatum]